MGCAKHVLMFRFGLGPTTWVGPIRLKAQAHSWFVGLIDDIIDSFFNKPNRLGLVQSSDQVTDLFAERELFHIMHVNGNKELREKLTWLRETSVGWWHCHNAVVVDWWSLRRWGGDSLIALNLKKRREKKWEIMVKMVVVYDVFSSYFLV
jgi:hypothetical protein